MSEHVDLERIKRPWEEQYRDDDVESMPWFCPELDVDVASAIESTAIAPKTALDLGTGPGTQAIALARLGFAATGTDISPSAVEKAKARAEKEGVHVSFVCDDILDSSLEARFGLIMDRGCFHVLDADQRHTYINTVSDLLEDDGLLFLKTFHKQETREEGPPNRFEAEDINSMFAPTFELITSSDSVFESTLDSDPKALFCVLKKCQRG